jgi:hypothetical protein
LSVATGSAASSTNTTSPHEPNLRTLQAAELPTLRAMAAAEMHNLILQLGGDVRIIPATVKGLDA